MDEPTDNPTRRRSRWSLVLPTAVLGLLVWTMVGCLYIPTWERVTLSGTKQDFRHLTVRADGPGKPIERQRTTRRQVEALLGPPPFASDDGLRVAYTLTSCQGLWVQPLCLAVGNGVDSGAALKINYDRTGTVREYDLQSVSQYPGPPVGSAYQQPFGGSPPPSEVIGRWNKDYRGTDDQGRPTTLPGFLRLRRPLTP